MPYYISWHSVTLYRNIRSYFFKDSSPRRTFITFTTTFHEAHSIVGIVTSYGWKTEGSEFESQQGKEFSLLHVVQSGSGVHPTSYPMGTGGSFYGGKEARV
jgi:hypothetical protein